MISNCQSMVKGKTFHFIFHDQIFRISSGFGPKVSKSLLKIIFLKLTTFCCSVGGFCSGRLGEEDGLILCTLLLMTSENSHVRDRPSSMDYLFLGFGQGLLY